MHRLLFACLATLFLAPCPIAPCLIAPCFIAPCLLAAPAQAAAGSAQTKPPPLVVTGSSLPARHLGQHLSWLTDPGGGMTLPQALQRYDEGRFGSTKAIHLDAGYGASPVWIVIETESRSIFDSTVILSTNLPYVPAVEMYWQPDGGAVELIQLRTLDTPYIAEQFSGQVLVSNQFIIKPGDKGRLVVRFQPYGMGLIPLSLESPESLFARTSLATTGYVAFYVFAVSMLVFFAVFNLALGSRGLFYFVFLFASGLLLIFQIDGFPQAWLWPRFPNWNRVASCPMLFLVNFSSLLLAGYMLRAGGFPRFGVRVQRLSWLILLPLLATAVFPVVWVIVIGLVFLPLSMGVLFFAVFAWARELRGQRYLAIAAGIGILAGVAFYMFHTLSGEAEVADANRFMLKVLYGLGSISIMTSYATHAAALNRNYRTALQREVDAARRDAELTQSLLVSERNFNRARDLADLRSRQLAAAAHDLRQPVASLRLMMDSFARNAEPSVRSNLARAFDYLEGLVRDNLDTAKANLDSREADLQFEDEAADSENGDTAHEDQHTSANHSSETFPLDIVLQASGEIYREEAISKQIELRVVSSTLEVHANAIALMRIAGNLVSNAVKHTERGKVLIGVRRGGRDPNGSDPRSNRPRIIVADTGKGMSTEDLARFKTAWEKGENSKGDGLGLAICFELAEEHGLTLDARSVPGKGTWFEVRM